MELDYDPVMPLMDVLTAVVVSAARMEAFGHGTL